MKRHLYLYQQRLKSFFYRLFGICYCGKERQHRNFEVSLTYKGGNVPGFEQALDWPAGLQRVMSMKSLEHKLTDEQKLELDYHCEYAEPEDDI